MSAHWYALRAHDELLTADFLAQAGYLAYVPCETVERKIRRIKVNVRTPLFPGYMFVRCSDQAFTAIRAIGAADDFVRFTDPTGVRVPLRLPHDALVPILLAEAFGAFDRTRVPPQWAPQRGDTVRITSGMWKGYLGAILSVGRKALIETKWCKLEVSVGDLELAA